MFDNVSLARGTPAGIVDTYRAAFGRIAADPGFLEQGKIFSGDLSAASHQTVAATVQAFGQAAPDVIDFRRQMLRRQGLDLH